MTHLAMLLHQSLAPRRVVSADGGSGGCGLGCFLVLLAAGVVLYLVLKGRSDRREALGAGHRPMGSGPLQPVTFTCPYPKCPVCGGGNDKMKQSWDGMRKVTWSCGYCGNQAGIQELRDEELPASARQRLGLDQPAMPAQGMPGYDHGGGGMGAGGLLTGMMIGSMMGGGGHGHHPDHPRDGGNEGGSSSGGDWGDSGSSSSSDWGDSGSSSDWGGGDSGGGDSGGGDSGGGSDW